MKKAIGMMIGVILVLAIIFTGGGTSDVHAETGSYEVIGVSMPYGENSRAVRGMLIDETTYLPLRNFSDESGAVSVTWNGYTKTATVKADGLVCEVTEGQPYIIANGRVIYSGKPNCIYNGRMYVPSRSICKAFGFDIYWYSDTRSVYIVNRGAPIQPADEFYDQNDLYWLSRIISCEAGETEPLLGQIAVGNVVLNRVEDPSSPNTVYDVIFDTRYGIQFTPAYTPKIYQEPTASAIIAAKICLEGYSLSDSALFFVNPRIATNNWIQRTRPFAFRIGNHDFYN